MIAFPNCKINLGLHVVEKMADGFHAIETVFFPVSWCDALEIVESHHAAPSFEFSQSGLPIDGKPETNLVYKAWQLISEQKKLPPIKVHLHKHIPMGAGLGGGSSDAAYFINLADKKFGLGLTDGAKLVMASRLGSDCAFFIRNTPLFATGRGNVLSEIKTDLDDFYILIVYPGIHSSTQEAYSGIIPKRPAHSLHDVVRNPVSEWKGTMVNDFEETVFRRYPEIKSLKEALYSAGALYASMSGSGSAVFGIFSKSPELTFTSSFPYFIQKPRTKIL